MLLHQSLQNPVGVGLALLLIAFAGRQAVQQLEQLELPETSLVVAALDEHLPAQETRANPSFPVKRESGKILLEYANGLAGCFIEEDLLPIFDWSMVSLLCTAADGCAITMEDISFPHGRLSLAGWAQQEENVKQFETRLTDSGRFPPMEWKWAETDGTVTFSAYEVVENNAES